MIPRFKRAKAFGYVQLHVSPLRRIDAINNGFTLIDVQAITGNSVQQFYLSIPGITSHDVKVQSLDGRTVTVRFQVGINQVPVAAVIPDPGNPPEVDIYY